jgi:hypothetical protein
VSYAETVVIDSILNLLFRCAHPRLTRPFSPVSLNGASQGGAYVVCLDCGRQFAYDLTEMKIGRPIDRSHEAAVAPSNLPMPRKKKLKYGFWAAGAGGGSRRRGPEDKETEPGREFRTRC